MRIVAGRAKGRRIHAPRGRDVRPTADRVREALFSSISSRLPGARVLDLFAGTGALGLEALSRGARAAVFVEQDVTTARLLRQNIDVCGMTPFSQVIRRDALAAVRQLAKQHAVFDIIFLDPPYRGPMLENVLYRLLETPLLEEEFLIVAEHPEALPPKLPNELTIVSTRHYGKTVLSFIQAVEMKSIV
jgi:16S rRNA (guanine966-N2)-methyltransferase